MRQLDAETGLNQLANLHDAYAEILIAEYPRIGSRRYNAGPERVLASVRALIADRSWEITATGAFPKNCRRLHRRHPAPAARRPVASDGPGRGKTGGRSRQEIAPELDEAPPLPDNIVIEAVASTPVFGFRNDVVIQIVSEAEATLVDMRSSSRYGAHDFGYNAKIIEKFLSDLDASLIGIAGEG